MAIDVRPNSLRDIELTRRFFNGETVRDIADSADLSTSRIQAMVESTVRRAVSHAKYQRRYDIGEIGMRKTPKQLLEIKDKILRCLELYEEHEKVKHNPVFDLNTSIDNLNLLPRVRNKLTGRCTTVGQLIDRLNAHQGTLGFWSIGEGTTRGVIEALIDRGYEEHFTFPRGNRLADVLTEMLIFIDDPKSFDEDQRALLRKNVENKLELYKNYKK